MRYSLHLSLGAGRKESISTAGAFTIMSDETSYAWDASPGDILLLSGSSKTRLLNLGYQWAARRQTAKYTHVALVLSPFRIIHAIPGEGVEIRAWSDVRDEYEVGESAVARFRCLDAGQREKLSARATYYFGQRYNIFEMYNPSEIFENQQGIVCSQFVAQVFEDIGIACTDGGARNCLPADIDTYAQENRDWERAPLSNYRFDPPSRSGDELTQLSRDLPFETDGYAARTTKEMYLLSRTVLALEATLESIATAVKEGTITPTAALSIHERSDDPMSTKSWISAWTLHFATPRFPIVFMHEKGVPHERMRGLFIESCANIGRVADSAVEQMEEIRLSFEEWISGVGDVTSDSHRYRLQQQLVALHNATLVRITHLDQVLGWQEQSVDGLELDAPAVYGTGVFESEEDIPVAKQCILDIANWTRTRNAWRLERASITALLDELSIALSTTVE